MNNITECQHMALLIIKQQSGIINEQEQNELNAWLSKNEANKQLYEHIIKKDFNEDMIRYEKIDTTKALRKYKERYHFNRKRTFVKWGAAAAVATIMIATTWLYINTGKETRSENAFIAGSTKAELILSSGKVVNLSDEKSNEVIADNAKIQSDGKQVSYIKLKGKETTKTLEERYNELRIPIGGEYTIVLEDGTKVWVNSQSKLKYPVSFNKNNRKVYLEGEAYFEVAKDSKRPFYVITKNDINVKVLGTSFNVRAYNDEDVVETVLEEGTVQMNWLNDSLVLKPSNLSIFNNCTKKMEVKQVDTDNYTAWKNGEFVFTKEPIESILHKLSRWYDMEVIFLNDNVKKISFSGNFKRYDNVSLLLAAIEMAGGVKFQKKENQLIVTNS